MRLSAIPSFRRSLLLLFAVVPIISGCRKTPDPGLTLEDLAGYNSLPVTIEGRLFFSTMTGDSCYYAEWAYGPMDADASTDLIAAQQSLDSIEVVTPKGRIKLDVFEIRTYIGSFFSRTFNDENAGGAPSPVQELVAQQGGTISVQEYLLEPKRTYYAHVGSDSIYIPAENGSGEDRLVLRKVLEISDLPFENGEPRRDPTPTYRNR